MGKEDFNGLSSFGGFNIDEIEKGLGLVMSESGDSGKTSEKSEEKTKTEKKTVTPLIDLTKKLQIPETEEEIKQLSGEIKIVDEEEEQEEKVAEKHEKKEIKEETKEETGDEDALITEDSPLFLHAATLHEEGILPTLDLESLKGKKYSEAVQLYLDAQKKYIEDGRNEYFKSLSDRQREFLEMIEKGIPQEEVEYQFNIEESYSKITDELLSDNSELQEQMVIQSLKLKGLNDKKIDIFLKAAKDDERLFEEAKDAKEEINAYISNQKKEMIRKAEDDERIQQQKEQELQKTIKSTIDSTEEIFPGIKISANEKTKLYNLMTKPVEEKVINGQRVPVNLINKIRMEDRVGFDLRLNYFIEQGLFNKNFDLSKLNKKITSTASEKLSMKLKESIGGPAGKGLSLEKKKNDKPAEIIFPQINT